MTDVSNTIPSDAHVVILAGGEGTRLWPLSRGRRPKQLLSLSSTRSLVQQTLDRVLPLVPAERVLVVTEGSHAEDLTAQLPELPRENVIIEATRRNTAPAMLLAALHIQARAPGATWASLWADAFIAEDREFRATLAAALTAAAEEDLLVTTGIRPTFAATGYGYIHAAEKIREVGGYPLHRVRNFVEKPNLETAQAYVRGGEYFWNPGVFAWRNSVLLAAFQRYQPELYGVLTSVPLERVGEVYARATKESIDNGIMERADNVATIPASFVWSDIGSWSELWEVLPHDADGNAHGGPGEHLLIESRDTLVYASHRMVAAVGVENLVIVETEDAIFVCPRERAQEVKLVVRALQERGATELL